jgi:hypothetical protein
MSHEVLRDPRLAQLARLKPVVAPPEPGDLVRLPLRRKAFIYQRLSTHEQRKKSLWSLEMQDALSEQAKADGYSEDQILVERRDLGISGTKGREERPGQRCSFRRSRLTRWKPSMSCTSPASAVIRR